MEKIKIMFHHSSSMQDIPVQPPVVVPVRTVQEAVAAGDLPPLDVDAANI